MQCSRNRRWHRLSWLSLKLVSARPNHNRGSHSERESWYEEASSANFMKYIFHFLEKRGRGKWLRENFESLKRLGKAAARASIGYDAVVGAPTMGYPSSAMTVEQKILAALARIESKLKIRLNA